MMRRIAFRPLAPVTASLLIHVGIAGTVVLGAGSDPVHLPVLITELVEAEAPPVVPSPPPQPVVRDRRPITPPRPIATPVPSEPAAPPRSDPAPPPVVPEPGLNAEPPKPPAPAPAVTPAPAPEAPSPAPSEPPPAPTLPAAAAPPGPVSAPAVRATAAPGSETFSAPRSTSPSAAGPAPQAPGLAAAAIPPDGVTQRANPRGGYQYRPAYPSSARSLGIQGTTLLHVLVSDSGRVAEVIVKQSAGHPDLDRAAADAVRRWRFEPARRGSDPVEMWVQLPIEFRLR